MINSENNVPEQVRKWAEAHESELIEDLRELVRIKSVSTPDPIYAMGEGCARCADAAMNIGQKWGFHAENHDYYCISLRMAGSGDGELGILGHLDVVPEGTGWSFDPYGAELREGYLIGRGSSDNKGACIMSLYAMRCIRELGLPMSHSVRLIMGFQEESGMKDVEHYLQVMQPPRFTIVCDGAWPMIIGEKGILTADLTTRIKDGNLMELGGGVTGNSVPDTAFARINTDRDVSLLRHREGIHVERFPDGLHVCASGVACHAMSPENGVNAIGLLANYLLEEELLTGDCVRAVRFLRQVLEDCYGTGLHIAWQDELSGRTTCIGGMVRLENRALTLNINVRYAITADRNALHCGLSERCAAAGYQVEQLRDSPPRYISPEQEPAEGLLQLYRRMTGDFSPPIIMGGGTHARIFPDALPFGPGHWGEKGKFGGAHSVDEAVCLRHLLDAIPIYVEALLFLDRYFTQKDHDDALEEGHV